MAGRKISNKHRGKAGEKLMAGEFYLAGFDLREMAANHEDYDLVVQTRKGPQRVCVKCRPMKGSSMNTRPQKYDWLAVVLTGERPHRFFVIPRKAVMESSVPIYGTRRAVKAHHVPRDFARYENNFRFKL